MEILKRWAMPLIAVGFAALIWVVFMLLGAPPASAGDLGGSCCADLEERIAELEATTARKANKKVSLMVYGQVNAALLYVDVEDYSNTTVNLNGNDETFVGFAGGARINGDLAAGYTLELEMRDLGILNAPVSNDGPTVRQSYWWIKSVALGAVSLGKTGQATRGFDELTTANTAVAAKPLSLGALSDAYITGVDVPFEGNYRQLVRYDSPELNGFRVSATWGPSLDATASDGNGDTFDAALRYSGEITGFKVVGGLGYRKGTDLDINVLNMMTLTVPTGDVQTWLAAGSIKHIDTGLFLTANYADQDWDDVGFTLKGYATTAGIERKWFSVGATTLYGEWSRFELESGGGDGEIDMYGAGIVQALDEAAMDLYISYRQYDLGDLGVDDLTSVTAGARIKF